MMWFVWLQGLLRRLPARLIGAAAGIALTVALLASLGAFIASSAAQMTQRALDGVPVDWQIQLAPGTRSAHAAQTVRSAVSAAALEPVSFADARGFAAATKGTVQTTSSGVVVGIPDSYIRSFPQEVRGLTGSTRGALLAQQTAANLHASVGDTIAIQPLDGPPFRVRVDGVVDLPYADSFFQAVGVPSGAPSAPPDNVALLPANLWHRMFDRQATARPATVRSQLHVRIAHDLPPSPTDAYIVVQRHANAVAVRLAGAGIIADNLSARLIGAREDALYARVLFLFLGVPGAALAVILTLAVTMSGALRRRREQALLRVRGATTRQILAFEGLESAVIAILGVGAGAIPAWLLIRYTAAPGADVTLWLVIACIVGLLVAICAALIPAWILARESTVARARLTIAAPPAPLWARAYLDIVLLAIAGAVFWQMASTGYQIVVAPEGVPQAAVHYQAFIAPLCLWLGAALLTVRLWNALLTRGRNGLAVALRSVAGELGRVVAAWLSRQRALVAGSALLVALAFSFAISTAVFNATFDAQARVDAQLTNGADVTVSAPPFANAASRLSDLRSLPGVVAAQAMQHRFAYVGNDLQDIYGINPLRIRDATSLADAFFAGHSAAAALAQLQSNPDGVLVSQETANDYQLHVGDLLRLRLQRAADHRYATIPFRFVGVVSEFPTAPRDSFLVANAQYIAQQSGTPAAEIVLLRVKGDPAGVAAAARPFVASIAGVRVTDLASAQRAVGSTLTAVDLRGLTTLELIFAVAFVTAATGLLLWLGLAERNRMFAVLTAIGASRRQLGSFMLGEALLVVCGGALLGVALGFAIAAMLVKLLTGVFDPPPEALTVPYLYITLAAIAALVSTSIAVAAALAASRNCVLEELRSL